MPAQYKNWPTTFIPANPADLHFEIEMRANSQQLLDSIISFDRQFVDAINSMGTETLSDGISGLASKADEGISYIADALTSVVHPHASASPYYKARSINHFLAGDPYLVRFTSISERFDYLDQIVRDAYNSNTEAGSVFFSIHERFSSAEGRITNNEQNISLISSNVTTLDNKISTEVATLDNKINTEVTTLDNKINTEVTTLDNKINTEVATLDGRINTEVTTLDNKINTEVTTLDGKITSNSTGISSLDARTTSIETDIDGFTGGSSLSSVMSNYVDTNQLNTSLSPYTSLLSIPTLPIIPSSGFAVTKYLATSGNSVTWEDAPYLTRDSSGNVIDPVTGNPVSAYEWVPDVAFQTMQFDGEVISDRSLAAGFNYFVAGNLHIESTDANGNPVELELQSSSQTTPFIKGAILIVQGHITGNQSGIALDQTGTNKPKLIVQNWSTTRTDYLIQSTDGRLNDGVYETSFINLEGKHIFPASLVIDPGCQLVIDTACELVFKNASDDTKSRITIAVDSSGDPVGSLMFIDDELDGIGSISDLTTMVADTGQALGDLMKKLQGMTSSQFLVDTSNPSENFVYLNQGTGASGTVTDQEIDDLISEWSSLMISASDSKLFTTKASEIIDVGNKMGDLLGKIESQMSRFNYIETVDPNTNIVQEVTFDFSSQPAISSDVNDFITDWKALMESIRQKIGSIENLQLLIG